MSVVDHEQWDSEYKHIFTGEATYGMDNNENWDYDESTPGSFVITKSDTPVVVEDEPVRKSSIKFSK